MSGLDSVVSLARTTAKVSVEITTAVAGRVIEEVRRRVDGDAPDPAPAPTAQPATPSAAPDIYDVLPPEPLVEEPTPDVPDEVVAESSDPGAEGGAGAAIRVDEPWDGYREMTAAAITDRLVVADAATLTQIKLYEAANRNRKTVITAVDRRLQQEG